jgi:hypothetical protein
MVKCGDWGWGPNPYSSHNNTIYIYIRCLTTFICCGCAYGCVPATLRPLMPTKLLEFRYKSGQLPPNNSWWNVVIERLRTQPIFISHQCYIYIKGVWQPLYAVDVHMDVSQPCYGRSCQPSFWNFATSLGNSHPITHGEMRWLRLRTQPIFISHQCYIYIYDVWQPLNAVDVHMDVSPPRYGRSCRPSFWNFATNLGNSHPKTHCEMQWLRL